MGSAPHKQRQMQLARAWIIKHPGASIAETMRAMRISQSSVSDLRKELKAAGLLGTYPHTPDPAAVETSEAVPGRPASASASAPHVIQSPLPDEEAEAVLSGTGQTTREERRKKLDALLRFGAPDHVIRANKAIEDMERQDVAPEDVGPPPPQTLMDGVLQVADMVEALAAWGGEGAVKEAVTMGLTHYHAQEPKFDVHKDVTTTATAASAELDLSRAESPESSE